MKVLLFILSFVFLSIVVDAQLPQTPGTQQRSLPANRPEDYNLFIRDQLGIPRFTDTTQANINTTLDTCGRIIYTYNADAFWIRACYPVKHWVQGTGSIVNIFNNSITNTTVINDSSVQICTGAGACGTINFQTFITNVSSTRFIDSTHLEICGTDTVTFESICDTLTIPAQQLYIFQNDLKQIAAGIVEGGTNPLLHNTTSETNSFIKTFSGAPVFNYPYQFVGRQSFENSTSLVSFLKPKGSLDPTVIDFANRVKLGINYTSNVYAASIPIPGYMNDKIGYWLGVNTQGHGTFGIYTDDSSSKSGGIFFHTLDTTSTDMVTIFGKHPPTPNGAIGITNGNTGFAPYRIATFRDNKDMTLWGYPNTRNDGTMTKTLGTNSGGDVILGTPLIPVQNLTGGNSGDIIKNINNVWTPLPDSVRLDTVYTQNWVAVGRGLTRDTIELGARYRDSSLLVYNTFLGMNTLSLTFNQGSNDLFKILSNGTNGIVSLPAHARFETGQGVSIAAANNLTLGGDGNVFTITGNTQINAITTANWQAGSQVELIFTGTPTVKNNTAGGAGTATILLAGSTDFTAAANDVLSLVYDGTNWHESARKTSGTVTSQTLQQVFNTEVGGSVLSKADTILANHSLKIIDNSIPNATSLLELKSTSAATAGMLTITATNLIAGGIGITVLAGAGTGINATVTGSSAAINGISTSGIGVTGGSSATYGGLFGTNSATATVAPALELRTLQTGAGATGLGTGIDFILETTTNVSGALSNQIQSVWTDATNATRTSQLIITGVNSAVTADLFTLSGSGSTRLNKYGIGAFTGTATKTLQVDASGNVIEGTLALISADNGLTANTATNVRLGGTLLTNTTITAGAFRLLLSGGTNTSGVLAVSGFSTFSQGAISADNTGNGYGIKASASVEAVYGTTTGNAAALHGVATSASVGTGGAGVSGEANTGIGVYGLSTDSSAIVGEINPSSTNTIKTGMILNRYSSGTPANGMGVSFDFGLKTNSLSDILLSNQIISQWTDATRATRTSQFSITGVNNAVSNTLIAWGGQGAPQYTINTVSGTTSTLTVNSKYVQVFTGSSGTTWTLPAIGNTGLTYIIKNRGSASITLNSNAGGNDIYTTSAVSSLTINAGESYTVTDDGTYFITY